MSQNNLSRFITAQDTSYATALSEIKTGKKRTHWMWYIFPQLKGLGSSSTSVFYGIKDLEEARSYLAHEVLGQRLIEISYALLALDGGDAHSIFGEPDHLKLRSSMTLFAQVREADPVFGKVLDKFFNGTPDHRTLYLLESTD